MRILWRATRAVTVEMLGVLLVVWLLFNAATWTMDAADAKPSQPWKEWGPALREHLAATLLPGDKAQRTKYADETLSRYSRYYRDASTGYIKRVTREVLEDSSSENVAPPISTELLGSL